MRVSDRAQVKLIEGALREARKSKPDAIAPPLITANETCRGECLN
jgi:hypothetical protein